MACIDHTIRDDHGMEPEYTEDQISGGFIIPKTGLGTNEQLKGAKNMLNFICCVQLPNGKWTSETEDDDDDDSDMSQFTEQ